MTGGAHWLEIAGMSSPFDDVFRDIYVYLGHNFAYRIALSGFSRSRYEWDKELIIPGASENASAVGAPL